MIAVSGSGSGFLLWLSDAGVGEEVIVWDAWATFGITGVRVTSACGPALDARTPSSNLRS